ncbi:MAG: acyl-CoA thioesterase [Spirochaetales bacterium]
MVHRLSIDVRHYECDVYNHVNNATYLNYLEFARERFLTDAGLDYRAWMAQGNGIWVAEVHLLCLSPAVAGEELTIASQTEEQGGAWAVLHQRILGPGDRPVLDARVKLVWVGPGGRPTRIPAEWKQRFQDA